MIANKPMIETIPKGSRHMSGSRSLSSQSNTNMEMAPAKGTQDVRSDDSTSFHIDKADNNVCLAPYKLGDLSSLPHKTVRYVLSSLWLSTNCRMPDSASRFYADPYKPESTRFRVRPPDS